METGLTSVFVLSPELHSKLADLMARYNVNDYAASVRVFRSDAA